MDLETKITMLQFATLASDILNRLEMVLMVGTDGALDRPSVLREIAVSKGRVIRFGESLILPDRKDDENPV